MSITGAGVPASLRPQPSPSSTPPSPTTHNTYLHPSAVKSPHNPTPTAARLNGRPPPIGGGVRRRRHGEKGRGGRSRVGLSVTVNNDDGVQAVDGNGVADSSSGSVWVESGMFVRDVQFGSGYDGFELVSARVSVGGNGSGGGGRAWFRFGSVRVNSVGYGPDLAQLGSPASDGQQVRFRFGSDSVQLVQPA